MLRIRFWQRPFVSLLSVATAIALIIGWSGGSAAQSSPNTTPPAAEDPTTAEDPATGVADALESETSDGPAEARQTLDRAFQRKLTARRLGDLDEVVALIEQALEQGLDEEGESFARQLGSQTLLEKAMQVAGPVLEGQIDVTWNQRRQLALSDLERASTLNPQDGEVLLMIARLHALPQGDRERGQEAVEKAVTLLTHESERHAAALVVRAGYCEDAEERLALYERAIVANDHNADAWRGLGKTKFELGRAEDALADFRHLLEINANDVETLQVIAAVLASQKEYDEALKHVGHMIEIDPEQPGGYLLRSRIYLAQGDIEKAEEELDTVLRLAPRNLGALLTRARLRHERGALDEALEDIDRVLQLRPRLPEAILLRSVVLIESEQYGKALEDVKDLLRDNPDNVGLQVQMARIYMANERPSLAVKTFDEVLKANQGNVQALRGRADAYLSLGKHAEAVLDYEEVLKQEPDDSGTLNNFAWVLATSPFEHVRDGARAVELAIRACEKTGYKAPHILSTLAAAHAESGDFEQAKQWIAKAIELVGESDDATMKQHLQDELEHYTQGKPYRELQVVEEPKEPEEPSVDDLKLEGTQLRQESAGKSE